jgi:hypothetical protein
MTKDFFMELTPYLIMGCGLTIALLELARIFQ